MQTKPVTSEELEDAARYYFTGEGVDQSALDAELDSVQKAIESSNTCTAALAGAKMHIIQRGPEHIDCGFNGTVGAFLMLGMRIQQARDKAAKDIAELDRIMGLSCEGIYGPDATHPA